MSEETNHKVGINVEEKCVELTLDGSVFTLSLDESGLRCSQSP